ncbi:MAG: hypothetical protein ACRDJI_08530, partial [Actinomycetota bacterium]
QPHRVMQVDHVVRNLVTIAVDESRAARSYVAGLGRRGHTGDLLEPLPGTDIEGSDKASVSGRGRLTR